MDIQIIELSEFLHTKAKLELFSHIGYDDMRPVVDALTEHCPRLKTFVDFHLSNQYRFLGNEEINNQMFERYHFVEKFADLTTIGVTSYTQCGSDLYPALLKLASKKKVEELKIYIDRDEAITLPVVNRVDFEHVYDSFINLESLKTIELQIKSTKFQEIGSIVAKFMRDFISNMKSVETVCIVSEHTIRDINKNIDLAPNVIELDIAQTKSAEIWKSSNCRRTSNMEPPLNTTLCPTALQG